MVAGVVQQIVKTLAIGSVRENRLQLLGQRVCTFAVHFDPLQNSWPVALELRGWGNQGSSCSNGYELSSAVDCVGDVLTELGAWLQTKVAENEWFSENRGSCHHSCCVRDRRCLCSGRKTKATKFD